MADHVAIACATPQDWRNRGTLWGNVKQQFEETINSIFSKTLWFLRLQKNKRSVQTTVGLAELMRDDAPQDQSKKAHMAYCFILFFIVDYLGEVLANGAGMEVLFSLRCRQASGLSSDFWVGGNMTAGAYFADQFKKLWKAKRKAIQRKIKSKADSFSMITGPSEGQTRARRDRLVFFRFRREDGTNGPKAGDFEETHDYRQNGTWMELERFFQLNWEFIIGVNSAKQGPHYHQCSLPTTTDMVPGGAGGAISNLGLPRVNLSGGTPASHTTRAMITPTENVGCPSLSMPSVSNWCNHTQGALQFQPRIVPGKKSQVEGLTTPKTSSSASITKVVDLSIGGSPASPLLPLLLEARIRTGDTNKTANKIIESKAVEQEPGVTSKHNSSDLEKSVAQLLSRTCTQEGPKTSASRISFDAADESSSDDDDGSIVGGEEPKRLSGKPEAEVVVGKTRTNKRKKEHRGESYKDGRPTKIPKTKLVLGEEEEGAEELGKENQLLEGDARDASSVKKKHEDLGKLVVGMKGLRREWCEHNSRKLKDVICDGPECGKDLGDWASLKPNKDGEYIFWQQTRRAPKDGVVCVGCYEKGLRESKGRSRRQPKPKVREDM